MEVEEQNSKILASLDARTDTRLEIQQALVGFSLIAISYYLIGLLKMTLKGLGALGSPLSAKVLFALLARRLKQAARY